MRGPSQSHIQAKRSMDEEFFKLHVDAYMNDRRRSFVDRLYTILGAEMTRLLLGRGRRRRAPRVVAATAAGRRARRAPRARGEQRAWRNNRDAPRPRSIWSTATQFEALVRSPDRARAAEGRRRKKSGGMVRFYRRRGALWRAGLLRRPTCAATPGPLVGVAAAVAEARGSGAFSSWTCGARCGVVRPSSRRPAALARVGRRRRRRPVVAAAAVGVVVSRASRPAAPSRGAIASSSSSGRGRRRAATARRVRRERRRVRVVHAHGRRGAGRRRPAPAQARRSRAAGPTRAAWSAQMARARRRAAQRAVEFRRVAVATRASGQASSPRSP